MEEQEEVKQGAPEWIVTFADLMSLLMTFFILLLSFSTMEISKFNTMAGSIKSAFGLRSPFEILNHPRGREMKPAETYGEYEQAQAAQVRDRNSKEAIMVQLRQALEESDAADRGTVKVSPRGVILELDGDAAFGSGGAELDEAARALLDELALVASNNSSVMEVEGHTDNVASEGRYASNWELSSARAGAAVQHLIAKGVAASRLRAVGYADTRPVASNETPEGRARNRRVSFLFLTSESYNGLRPPSKGKVPPPWESMP